MMAGKAGPSSVTTGLPNSVSSKRLDITINKPAVVPGKLKLKAGCGGGKNLLPSKVVVQQTSTGKENNGPTRSKPWKVPAAQPLSSLSSVKNSNQLVLNAYYGKYLQSLMESALLEEIRETQRSVQVDSLASTCLDIPLINRQLNKIYADHRSTKVFSGLCHLDMIYQTFDNLFELTGEDILKEIRNILSNKYDKVRVEGAEIEGPLFQKDELENILKLFRARKCAKDDNNDNRVILTDWCSEFVDKLRELTVNLENASENAAFLQAAARVLLENCSLIACEDARNCEADGDETKKANEQLEIIEERMDLADVSIMVPVPPGLED